MPSFQRVAASRLVAVGLVQITLLVTIFSISPRAYSQTLEQSAQYVSKIDEQLTVRKVAVLPVADNLQGIYARPIESHLNTLVKNYHQWDLVDTAIDGKPLTTAEVENNPAAVLKYAKDIEADALLSANVVKGPLGITIKLSLLLKSDGKVLLQEVLSDYPKFEIPELKTQVELLFKKLVAKMPYNGLVLSRQQNTVTLNLGRSEGIVKDQTVTVIQIIKVTRHPKFNFLVSTDKEIIGKIKILKVDDTLSFGAVISEKERGTIKRFSKVSGLDFVEYTAPAELGSKAVSLEDRPDAKVTFGKNPGEWLPAEPPSFGQVGLKLGFGNFTNSVDLSLSGSQSTTSSIYPSLSLFGEIWLNPNWIIRAEIFQGIASTKNPVAGSAPAELNNQISKYSLAVGYNFLLQDDFFGPKLQLRGGLSSYRAFVDNTAPMVFTTLNYSGLLLGVNGSLPVTKDKRWSVGAGLNLTMLAKLSESPESSGNDAKNSITDFNFYGEHRIRPNLNVIAGMDFWLYSTSFGGGGGRSNGDVASSLSQRHIILSGGIAYLF